jgi:ubiquinone/menaquinone biosynthesis C-methylase UbiE
MASMRNFDFVAPFYDTLSGVVFGNAMHAAQTMYLRDIAFGANVLILGGGTGWLLSELTAINPTCKVWYIEASQEMINLSKAKLKGARNEIFFIHGTETNLPTEITFDAVITNFFFDLFSTEECGRVIASVRPVLHAKAIWLISDFVNATWWHSALLAVMYRFFRMTSGVTTSKLSNWGAAMERGGFKEKKSGIFYGSFIKSASFSPHPEMNS